ncbi:hypothetical protein ACFOGI_14770 [Virgibacillus xinjiangensis]|uniref:Uncharacterized protein n=1 Tax=Virgibacillus xinjiangensis TaxID=393090 RepID=A0ABV7CZH7_9BACI
MKKLLILAFLVPMLLAACSNDEPADEPTDTDQEETTENGQEEETAGENEEEPADETTDESDQAGEDNEAADEGGTAEEAPEEEADDTEGTEDGSTEEQKNNEAREREEVTFQGLADSHSMEVQTAEGDVKVVSFSPDDYELLGELSPGTTISYELTETEDGMVYAENVEVVE